MKLEGRITMLISQHGTTIEIEDHDASTTFLKIELSSDQLAAILSRQGMVRCELELTGIDRIGKTHENKTFEFEIPEGISKMDNDVQLQEIAQSQLSDGWIAESYFRSQSSFFQKDGKQFARCTIRRWI